MTGSSTRTQRRGMLQGASALALVTAALAGGPASAQQARPGSAQCPVADGVVTCSGTVPEGIVIADADAMRELRVRDLTAPIAPATGRSGISFDRNGGPVTIVTQASAFGIAVSGVGDGILARTVGNRIAIDNTLNIVSSSAAAGAGNPPVHAGIRAVSMPGAPASARGGVDIINAGTIEISGTRQAGGTAPTGAIVVQLNSTADVSITNRGDLRYSTSDDTVTAAAISIAGGNGSDGLSIVNDGTLTLNGSGLVGIRVGDCIIAGCSATTPTISVRNTGNITGLAEAGMIVAPRDFTGGTIAIDNRGTIDLLGAQGTQGISLFADGRNNLTADARFAIANSGNITITGGSGTGEGIFFQGVEQAQRPLNPFTSKVSIVNSGDLFGTQRGGIAALDASYDISNSGAISTRGSSASSTDVAGILARDYFFDLIPTDSTLLATNILSNTGQIRARTGILAFAGGALRLTNQGAIIGDGDDGIGLGVISLTSATVSNYADITMSGARSHGVVLVETSLQTDADINRLQRDPILDLAGRIDFTHAGTITATGVDADGIRVLSGRGDRIGEQLGLTCGNNDDDAAIVFCAPGAIFSARYDASTTVTIESGLVSGGTGGGAGVRLFGEGNHLLDNSGTITALSGRAVIGGIGRDTVINRGTILGTVALEESDDRFVLTATGNLPLVDGAAGTDTFALEAAAGAPFAFDVARAATLTGFERFDVQGTGLVSLTGVAPAALPRALFVESGAASVETDLTGFTAQVAAGATLAGTGRLGATLISDGGVLSPGGTAVGTLALGSLALSAGSMLRFDLGRPDSVGGADNDLISAGGDLTLDGTLDVVAQPLFGDGVYRLINYGGALTDNGLALGTLPGGATGQVQTVIGGQVNLVVGSALQFWDGADTVADLTVDGGSGTWNTTTTNWTRRSGDVNEAWSSGIAVFQGAPGIVTIAPEGVTAAGLQFAIDGYRIDGGPLTLAGAAMLRVGDGSAAGAGYTATIAAAVGGAGSIDKTDLGTLVLSGVNGFAGGTRISGGVLSVAADGALGTGGVTLNGGTVRTTAGFASARGVAVTALGGTIDTAGGTFGLSGVLSGGGALTKTGSGTLALSGDAGGFTGATSVAADTLDLRTTLGGTLSIGSGAALAGSGSAGTTTVRDGGTLAPGGGAVGTLTLASLNLSAGSRLAFGLGAPGVVGGTVNDLVRVTGNLVLDGTLDVTALPGFGEGVYRLFDYGGALTDNGLALGSVSGAARVQTILPGQVNLVVGTALQYWDGTSITADLRVDGGTATWNDTTTNWTRVVGDVNESWRRGFAVFQGTPGIVTIAPEGIASTGLQFAVDGYRVEGGPLTLDAPATLRVGDGSAGGAGYTATIASSIAGTGGVFKTDLGTLILTGTNSYTGGISVNGGVLQVTSDASLGAVAGGVTLDGGTLRLAGALTSARSFTIGAGGGTFDTQANTATFSGMFGGAGSFTKTGSGILAFGGNGMGLTGPTRIAAGTLALTGSLGGPLSIASGATLTGTGRAGSLDLAGIVAPGTGTATGTLAITGDALLRAGSTYRVDLAGTGGTDVIRVGGAAIIQGGSVGINQLDARSAYADGAVYRILDAAGGRTGTFAAVTRSSLLFGFTLGYDPTGAFVTARAITTTYNQGQAALGLEAFDRTTGADAGGMFAALLALDTDPLRAALDAGSGEIYAGLLADALGSGTTRADRLVARATTPAPEGWGLWGGLDGRTGRIDGDGNAARVDHGGYGFDLGIDYRGGGNGWAVGAGGGYTHTSLVSDARSARARGTGWQLGGYARYGTGGAGVTASVAASYQQQDADVTRRIAFAGVDRTADGRASVKGTAATGELRYGVAVSGNWSLGPIASIHYAHASIGDIREIGVAALALSGQGDDDRTRYGGGGFVNWQSGRGSIDLSARYVGGDTTTSNVALAFAGAPAAAFDIRSPRIRAEAALVDLGTRYDFGRGWSIAGTARATIARDQRSISGNATLGWRF